MNPLDPRGRPCATTFALCTMLAEDGSAYCTVHRQHVSLRPTAITGVRCEACGGDGQCSTCGGRGTHYCACSECGDEHKRDCGTCDGSGDCHHCDGTGDALDPNDTNPSPTFITPPTIKRTS